MSDSTLNPAYEAAIDWLVTLHSGAVTDTEHRHFQAWLAQPSHRATWDALAGPLDATLAPARAAATRLPGTLGAALARAEARTRARRQLLRGALALGGMATLLAAERHAPLAQLAADLRTGTGERRNFTLPDGSVLTLDARSAADIDFSAQRRTVTLRQGALIANVAAQSSPFVVRTAHGQVRALGTRFVVQIEAGSSYVGMLEHSTEVTARNGQQWHVAEGQSIRFDARGVVQAAAPLPQTASAWQHGLLQAHDQPLGDVINTLRAWRTGFIRISPRAAALRVYGSYALDDTDRALAALAETLPITVQTYRGGWLVVIE
ncbi:FecR domain-containing protein [Comamonas sp.]|uniref:FecR domain-containing protein n=1 Tax=Comamonas sp. TaxID=34028 RepID=UPI002FCAE20E